MASHTSSASPAVRPRSARKAGTVKNEGKLVLMFILLVILVYSVIIRKHIYMPVDYEDGDHGGLHIKHGRSEKARLRAEFHQHRMDHNRLGNVRSDPGRDMEASVQGRRQDSIADQGGTEQGSGAGSVQRGTSADAALWAERRAAVVQATKETWAAYEEHAMGYDELLPVTKLGKNTLGGMGATVIDSLDTLWLMGLRAEYERARAWVERAFEVPQTKRISLFETTIRIVGGFLAAYDLTKDALYVEKARGIVDCMMPYLETSATGIPPNSVVLKQSLRAGPTHPTGSSRAALAEYGTLSLEFLALSQRTGDPRYGQRALAIIQLLNERYPTMGLIPVWIQRTNGRFTANQLLTVGAMADSYYEYLLKAWLFLGKQGEDAELSRGMWERSMDDALARLAHSGSDGLMYMGSISQRPPYLAKMEHLACYLPGNLALGVAEGAVGGAKGTRYLAAARGLTATCWHMYLQQPTGLSPEFVWFNQSAQAVDPGLNATVGSAMKVGAPYNSLRPEAVESLFYMWRITREPQYREWAWAMFEAFRRYCRLPDGAFSGLKDVRNVTSALTNGLETFWLAETLKYFWLTFSAEDELPWNEWVLNTEAHPLRIQRPGIASNASVIGSHGIA